MKEPIEPSEIRAGDLIRCEIVKAFPSGSTAHEFRASIDRDVDGWNNVDKFNWFLLDRPRRLMHAAGSTLWLTRKFYPWSKGDQITIKRDWFEGEDGVTTDGSPSPMVISADAVTTSPPFTGVPTEALDELREYSVLDGISMLRCRIEDFLAAVDAANGATS